MNKATAKGILIGLLVFSGMYFGSKLYIYYHPIMTGQDMAILLFNLNVFLELIAPGYIAATISRRNGLLLGAVTGLLAACITTVYYVLSRKLMTLPHDWYGWFIQGICFGAFGGLLRSLQVFVMRYTRPKRDYPV